MIMNAKDIRLLFLTGTPITKDPFELVPCINMLVGKEVLPFSYELFYTQYVQANNTVKNLNKLQNRLLGLVSYISFLDPKTPEDIENSIDSLDFPEDKGFTLNRIEMSLDQYNRYITIRDEEEKIKLKKDSKEKTKKEREVPPNTTPSSVKRAGAYYVSSRQISNFGIPLQDKEATLKLPDNMFTKETSPKVYQLIK